MKDFIHRTITAEKGGLKVSRMVTSNGYEQISIEWGTVASITFNRSRDEVAKTAPVALASDLVGLLNEIINDPCTLPVVPEVKYGEGKL